MSRSSRRKARNRQRQRVAMRTVTATLARPQAVVLPKRPVAPAPRASRVVAPAEPGAADALHRLLAPTGLTNVAAIAGRDLVSLIASPAGWVVAALFTFFVSGLGFIVTVVAGQGATMDGVFGVVANYLVLILVPVLTMRAFAGESGRGTLELLLTAPVRDWEVTVAKWLGAFLFYALLLATTLVYVAILRLFAAQLDMGLVAATYLGLLLVGGAAVAIGILASSLTRNQVVAFLAAMAALVVTWYAGYLIGGVAAPPASLFFEYVAGFNRYQSFTLGQAELRDVVYFLALTAGGLFLSTRVIASRRWR